MGRPSKFTEALANDILTNIANGQSTSKAIEKHDITTVTFFDWLQNKPEFSNRYARAKEIAMERMADEILEISDDTTNDIEEYEIAEGIPATRTNHEVINRSRLRVDTRKWLMSKLAPKKYGDKQQLEHSGEVTTKAVLNVSMSGNPDQSQTTPKAVTSGDKSSD